MADYLSQALVLVNKDFAAAIPPAAIKTREDFHQALAGVVQHLLDHDFERLLNALYRIDVSEEKVKQAMASEANVAGQIAGLIIAREMQKVVTREKYRQE